MSIRQLIFHNFWLKLLSVLLAAFLYLVVQANLSDDLVPARRLAHINASREFIQRPVLVVNESTQRSAFQVNPSEVNVTVSGPVALIEQMREHEVRVFVRVTNGTYAASARVEVQTPRAASVLRVVPDVVMVRPLETP